MGMPPRTHVKPGLCHEGRCTRSRALELDQVSLTFQVSRGLFAKSEPLHAVAGVNLTVAKGETVGLVGESGCGKSTLARILLGILKPSAGRVLVEGTPIDSISQKMLARVVQPVFQDPYSSLNPARTVGSIVEHPLRIHGRADDARKKVVRYLDLVGFSGPARRRLSGGTVRRPAAAGGHSTGFDPRTINPDLRRANERAGRVGAGANPQPSDAAQTRTGPDDAVHQPQPRRCRTHRRPHGCDVSRPDCGRRFGPSCAQRSASSVYACTAVVDPATKAWTAAFLFLNSATPPPIRWVKPIAAPSRPAVQWCSRNAMRVNRS